MTLKRARGNEHHSERKISVRRLLNFKILLTLGIIGCILVVITLVAYRPTEDVAREMVTEILAPIVKDADTYGLAMEFAFPFNESELTLLIDYFEVDYDLTWRALVAAEYLKDSAGRFNEAVVANLTMVNDTVDVVLRHRFMNNGMDDPSGFVSVADLIKLMYYRWTSGYVDLPDGTRVSRRELSDEHLNATLTFADDSWRVLPTLGGYVYKEFEDGKERFYFSYAPYSQTASHDPRFTIAPFWNETGTLHVLTNGTIDGIPWDESYLENVLLKNKEFYPNWDQWYKWWTDAGRPYALPILREWLKNIDLAPTEAAKDLDALKNGFLNMTEIRYSYLPLERQSDIQQGDNFLIQKRDFVDNVPIGMRPFTQYTSSFHRYFETKGLSESIPLLSELYKDAGAFRAYKEFGLPDPEKAIFYSTGVQYIYVPSGKKFAGEYFGVMTVDDSDADPRGNYTDTQNRFQIIDGRLIAFGEPMPIASYDFPFVSEKTGDYYGKSLYAKYFLLCHNLIDEGNPWLKVFDNTDEL